MLPHIRNKLNTSHIVEKKGNVGLSITEQLLQCLSPPLGLTVAQGRAYFCAAI